MTKPQTFTFNSSFTLFMEFITNILDTVAPEAVGPVSHLSKVVTNSQTVIKYVESYTGRSMDELYKRYAAMTETEMTLTRESIVFAKKGMLKIKDGGHILIRVDSFYNQAQALDSLAGLVQYELVVQGLYERGTQFVRESLGGTALIIHTPGLDRESLNVEKLNEYVSKAIREGGSPKRVDGTRLINAPHLIALKDKQVTVYI